MRSTGNWPAGDACVPPLSALFPAGLCRKRHRFHTTGTQMLAAGVAIEVMQCAPGHASLDTTSIYVSPDSRHPNRAD